MDNLLIVLFAVPFALVFLGLWVWSIVWAYRDAEARGKSGVLVALMVALVSWPTSLLIWIVFRPDGITPASK
ncbi:hypothetical protein ACFLT9_08765 [Acidobacteriota bacterium]